MRTYRLIPLALVAILLTACGSMGGTTPEPVATAPVVAPVTQEAVTPTLAPTFETSEGAAILDALKGIDCKSKAFEQKTGQNGSGTLSVSLTDCEVVDL